MFYQLSEQIVSGLYSLYSYIYTCTCSNYIRSTETLEHTKQIKQTDDDYEVVYPPSGYI